MTNGPSYLANFNSFTNLNHDFYWGPINAQTGTTYTIDASDLGTLTTFSNASSIAVTLPVAGNAVPLTSYGSDHQFAKGWFAWFYNIGAGDVTITPTTSTINGAATLILKQGDWCMITVDGANYRALLGGISVNSASSLANKTLVDPIHLGEKVCTSTLTKSANTTMESVAGLSVDVTGGATYNFTAHLTGTASVSGGIKVQMGGTCTATSITYTAFNYNGTTLNAVGTATSLASALGITAAYTDIMIEGSIVVNAAGTLTVQAAQNAASGTTTVLVNSNLSVRRVA